VKPTKKKPLPPARSLQLYVHAGRELIAEGCGTILQFDDSRIRFQAGKLEISVDGTDLAIQQLGLSGLIIRGILTDIHFSSQKE